MGYTYNWIINQLKKQNSGSLSDIIIGTQWKVTGIDDDGYSGSFSGATPFKPSDVNISDFTEFNSLTEEKVIGWIQNVVSGSSYTNYWSHIQEKIDEEIHKNKHVVVEVMSEALPWGTGSIEPPYDPAAGESWRS